MRKIEIFTAGCPVCDEQVAKIKEAACSSCEIEVLNVKESEEALKKGKSYNINSLPSVVIDGVLAQCCSNRGIDIDVLKSLGLGKSN
jgi:glutaredoxin 3